MASKDSDAFRELGHEIVTFIPDLTYMVRQVVADPRVPQSVKIEAAVTLGYLVSPKNRFTNLIPVIGQLDDVAVVALAFHRLMTGVGEPILREHWRGSDRAFQALINASAALATPKGMVRRAKIARSLMASAFDKISGRADVMMVVDDDSRIVDGEVVDRGRPPSPPFASPGVTKTAPNPPPDVNDPVGGPRASA
jgi:uncharacterized membrane protein YkvA (DUF1232 family)